MAKTDVWYDFSLLKLIERSIMKNLLTASEMNVDSASFKWNVLHMSVKSIGLTCCLSLMLPYWFFYPDDLSIDESGVLKYPILL